MSGSRLLIVAQFICLLCCCGSYADEDDDLLSFPEEFILGVGTSAYQVEGAWNEDGKGESVLDRYFHSHPEHLNSQNADVASDSYHRIEEDIANIQQTGMKVYRFSVSWTRILPNGFTNEINQLGLDHYKNLIDGLLANGIEPFVTLCHFDHPQVIEDLGGWTNEAIVDWFGDYARIVFRELGPKVKYFTTINEPGIYCRDAYGAGEIPPYKRINGVAEYLCGHNALKAHARAYHIYDEEFRPSQNGTIGISFLVINRQPKDPKNPDDVQAAENAFQFETNWFAHPIFSPKGDYSNLMKETVALKSRQQGYSRSRLPVLSQEWISYIRGTSDFFSLNHYVTVLCELGIWSDVPVPSFADDMGIVPSFDSRWQNSSIFPMTVVPAGLGRLLRKLKTEYPHVPIYITENGFSDEGGLDDRRRVEYFHDYIKEVLIAINRDNVDVRGYFAWALLDTFEWKEGYKVRFGLVDVDFAHPNKTRTPKLSAKWFKKVNENRRLIPAIGFKDLN